MTERQETEKKARTIDYYCFPTKTGDISVFTDLKQYADDLRLQLHFELAQEDVLLAKEKGKLVLFDLRNHTFIDENGNPVNISGKTIFPRSTIQESDLLLEYIEKANGKSITSRQDYQTMIHWFELIQTERPFKKTEIGEILKNIEDYEKEFGKKFFLKTIQKGFSGVCFIIEANLNSEEEKPTKFLMGPRMRSVNMSIKDKNTPVLVYPALKLISDDYGKREWRVFVVQNQLWCISRTSDELVPIEDYVYEKVKAKIKEFERVLPSSYVVDFFEYETEDGRTVFDVCEFNPIIASGVYRNNDLVF